MTHLNQHQWAALKTWVQYSADYAAIVRFNQHINLEDGDFIEANEREAMKEARDEAYRLLTGTP